MLLTMSTSWQNFSWNGFQKYRHGWSTLKIFTEIKIFKFFRNLYESVPRRATHGAFSVIITSLTIFHLDLRMILILQNAEWIALTAWSQVRIALKLFKASLFVNAKLREQSERECEAWGGGGGDVSRIASEITNRRNTSLERSRFIRLFYFSCSPPHPHLLPFCPVPSRFFFLVQRLKINYKKIEGFE